LLAGLSTLHSASTSITTASRLTGHPASRQSATDAPIGEPHLTTDRMVVSRLARRRSGPISVETPLVASKRGPGRAYGAGSDVLRQRKSRASGLTVTNAFRTLASPAPQVAKVRAAVVCFE
jgi:hypothetical protein